MLPKSHGNNKQQNFCVFKSNRKTKILNISFCTLGRILLFGFDLNVIGLQEYSFKKTNVLKSNTIVNVGLLKISYTVDNLVQKFLLQTWSFSTTNNKK